MLNQELFILTETLKSFKNTLTMAKHLSFSNQWYINIEEDV
jgi:hypothetical protein